MRGSYYYNPCSAKHFFFFFLNSMVLTELHIVSLTHKLFCFQMSPVPSYPFPTVDVPDHAHYIIGVVILFVGITGMLGNFLVIYAFCRYSLNFTAILFLYLTLLKFIYLLIYFLQQCPHISKIFVCVLIGAGV